MAGLAEEMKCLEEFVMLLKEGVRSALFKNLVAHIPTINIIKAHKQKSKHFLSFKASDILTINK